jgi:hypothetical protein
MTGQGTKPGWRDVAERFGSEAADKWQYMRDAVAAFRSAAKEGE